MTFFSIRATKAAAVVLILSGSAAYATTPPLDCHRARSPVAHAVCDSPEFVAMDREISALNDRGMAAFGRMDQRRLAQSQLAYFKRRNGCAWAAHHSAHPGTAMDECVRAAMEDRLRAIRAVVDRGGY